MTGILDNLIQVLKAVPTGKKISFLITILVLIGGFTALILWANRPDYQVLFSNLDSSDAAKIADKLRESRTPFQLKDGGTAILVPNEKVYQLRLEMASEGIPRGGGVGFEVFDDMSFGTTEFVQKLKYQQALQGELARTIMDFDAIEQARVHIVPAGDSLFAEPEKPSTASVVIRPRMGYVLDQRQLQGIVNLVACAVEGLKPSNVTVVDMAGGLLSNGHDNNDIGDLTTSQFDFQRKLENSLEKRIRTMLEPVVGLNKVVARVSADVDFRQINISEEKYDPDSVVVRSEQKQKESSMTGGSPSGGYDQKYQVYQSEEDSSVASSKTFDKENSIINYEMNKVNTHIIDTAGDIIRLSAAVIIDGPYVTEEDDGGNKVQKFVARDRKEMKRFEEIIKSAIGFDEARGDQVSVSNIAFSLNKETPVIMEDSGGNLLSFARKQSKYVFNVLLIILFFVLAVRPFKRWLNQTGEYVSTMTLDTGKEVKALEAPDLEIQQRQNTKQQVLEATRQNPDIAADIIKSWINEVS